MSGTVTVRMLTRGPNKSHRPREVLVVDAARAAALIAGRHAEPVDAPVRKEVERDADD